MHYPSQKSIIHILCHLHGVRHFARNGRDTLSILRRFAEFRGILRGARCPNGHFREEFLNVEIPLGKWAVRTHAKSSSGSTFTNVSKWDPICRRHLSRTGFCAAFRPGWPDGLKCGCFQHHIYSFWACCAFLRNLLTFRNIANFSPITHVFLH